jgi:hypothetical protein
MTTIIKSSDLGHLAG